jgi:transposase
MGVDEIHLGEKQKFITVVSNLDSGEPVWFGRERKKETLDEFFQSELSAGQQMRIAAACVDMWEPYRLSIEQWAPNCRIVYDKFHVMQHANKAIDEVRRAEFFRKGGRMRCRPRSAPSWAARICTSPAATMRPSRNCAWNPMPGMSALEPRYR